MTEQDFVGTWALKSWHTQQSGGELVQPYGDAPHGYIIYSEAGYMSAQIQGNGGDGVIGGGLFLAYGGPYTVEGDTVIHHVELANWPLIIGSDQRRQAEFNGNQLVLSATARDGHHVIRWQRA